MYYFHYFAPPFSWTSPHAPVSSFFDLGVIKSNFLSFIKEVTKSNQRTKENQRNMSFSHFPIGTILSKWDKTFLQATVHHLPPILTSPAPITSLHLVKRNWTSVEVQIDSSEMKRECARVAIIQMQVTLLILLPRRYFTTENLLLEMSFASGYFFLSNWDKNNCGSTC